MNILPLSGIKGEGSPGGAESHLSSPAQLSLARMPAWLLVFAAVSKTFGSPSPLGEVSHVGHAQYTHSRLCHP